MCVCVCVSDVWCVVLPSLLVCACVWCAHAVCLCGVHSPTCIVLLHILLVNVINGLVTRSPDMMSMSSIRVQSSSDSEAEGEEQGGRGEGRKQQRRQQLRPPSPSGISADTSDQVVGFHSLDLRDNHLVSWQRPTRELPFLAV